MRWRGLWAVALLVGCRTQPVEEPPPDLAPPANACGGRAALERRPGDPCGECGSFRCAGGEALACVEEAARNACGDCGPLPAEECNGRDDDCDGRIDEGCAVRLGLLADSDEIHVRVSGDRVALDLAASNSAHIGLFTLPGAALEVLTPQGGMDGTRPFGVELDGPLVAWAGGPPTAYDVRSRRRIVLSASPLRADAVAVDGRRVALQAGSPPRIHLWEVDGGQVSPVTDPGASSRRPDLSGDWLVFERPRGQTDATDVFARHLPSGEEINLSNEIQESCTLPAIDGQRVVWSTWRRADDHAVRGETYLYDLSNGERRQLSNGSGMALAPRISGLLVCWSGLGADTRWGRGVTVHDLETGRERLVAPNGGWCDVSGRRLVWSEPAWSFDAFYRDLLPGEP